MWDSISDFFNFFLKFNTALDIVVSVAFLLVLASFAFFILLIIYEGVNHLFTAKEKGMGRVSSKKIIPGGYRLTPQTVIVNGSVTVIQINQYHPPEHMLYIVSGQNTDWCEVNEDFYHKCEEQETVSIVYHYGRLDKKFHINSVAKR